MGLQHRLKTLRFVAASAAALLLGAPAQAVESITLVTPTNSMDTVISEVVLNAAYTALGIDLTVRRLPAARALAAANAGQFDGEVQRIDGLSRAFPNLVQVRIPTNYIDAVVFTARDNSDVARWQDLSAHRVGIIRGIKFAEQRTEGMNRLVVSDYKNLFVMLSRDRIDYAVSPLIVAEYHIRQNSIRGVRASLPPLERFELFHYLHKRHIALVPQIEAELARMQQRGQIAALRNLVFKEMLARASRGLAPCDDVACYGDAIQVPPAR